MIITQGTQIYAKTEFQLLGKRFEELGKAMQSPTTRIEELAGLAHKCGIRLEMRLAAVPEESSDD